MHAKPNAKNVDGIVVFRSYDVFPDTIASALFSMESVMITSCSATFSVFICTRRPMIDSIALGALHYMHMFYLTSCDNHFGLDVRWSDFKMLPKCNSFFSFFVFGTDH